jgi:hypothetical protein
MSTDSKLFEKDHETPEGTIVDSTMVVAYGKTAIPTLNISWTGIVTWLTTQLGAIFTKRSNNLGDLVSASTARANLGAASKYLLATDFVYSGQAQGTPQLINVDPTTVDVINLTSTGGSWFKLPMPADYPIPTGTHIIIRNPGGASKGISRNGTEISNKDCYIGTWGSVEFYFNGTYWAYVTWNPPTSIS